MVDEKDLILFCVPEEGLYRGKTEEQVAKEYSAMAFEGFDRLVKFSRNYEPWRSAPDVRQHVGEKQGRTLDLTIFANQEVVGVGNLDAELISSSYLSNPQTNLLDIRLSLPDFEAVRMAGRKSFEAIEELQKFYKSFGWKTFLCNKGITPSIMTKVQSENSERNLGEIKILDPTFLKQTAHEELGYDFKKLCFDVETI